MNLPGHQQYLEAPYLAADLAAEQYERWAEQHSGADARKQVAQALIADLSPSLTQEQWSDTWSAIAYGLEKRSAPTAEIGAALELWPAADADKEEQE